MIWARSSNAAVTADYLIEGAAVAPHEITRATCPRCGARLSEWPGAAVYAEDDDGGELLYWEQTHACGARLRVLAPPDVEI